MVNIGTDDMHDMLLKDYLKKQLSYGLMDGKEFLFVAYIRPDELMWRNVAELVKDNMTVVFVKASKTNWEHFTNISIFTDYEEMYPPLYSFVRLIKREGLDEFEYVVMDSSDMTVNNTNGNSFEDLIDCLLQHCVDVAIVSENGPFMGR